MKKLLVAALLCFCVIGCQENQQIDKQGNVIEQRVPKYRIWSLNCNQRSYSDVCYDTDEYHLLPQTCGVRFINIHTGKEIVLIGQFRIFQQ